MSEIKVITSIQRRRRWTAEAKKVLIEEAEQPGRSISSVARKYEINPSLLFRWRRLMREGALEAVRKDERVVPISEVKALKNRVRELERRAGPRGFLHGLLGQGGPQLYRHDRRDNRKNRQGSHDRGH